MRLSVGLDPASYARLSRLADRHGVSLAWMIRRAIADLIERQQENDQMELPLQRRAETDHPGRT